MQRVSGLVVERAGRQARKGDEADGGEFAESGECRALGVARRAQAGADAGKVRVVVAGVGDELPCAGRKVPQQRAEGGLVEDAGAGYGDGAAGGDKSFLLDNPPTSRFQPAQSAHLRQA